MTLFIPLAIFIVGVAVVSLVVNGVEKTFWSGKRFTFRRFFLPAIYDERDHFKMLAEDRAEDVRVLNIKANNLRKQVDDLHVVLEWNEDKMKVRNLEYGAMQEKLEDAKQELLKMLREYRELENVTRELGIAYDKLKNSKRKKKAK